MHILHIVHQYPPEHLGGTELYTQNLVREQAARGHTVSVFYPTAKTEFVDSSPNIQRRPVPLGKRSRVGVFFASFGQKRLVDALDLSGVDLVHVQHLMGLPLTLIDKVRAANIPYVITLHDYWFPCANAQLIRNTDQALCDGPDTQHHNCGRCALARIGLPTAASRLVAPLLRQRARQLKPIFENARLVVAPTHFVRKAYVNNGFGGDNVRVIPHGIRHPQMTVLARPKSTLNILYVGSIAWQKGVHVLVDAVAGLSDQFQLTIAGGLTKFPDYAVELQQRAKQSNTTFLGAVPPDEIGAVFGSADLLALPSLWYEMSPLVLDEAFACGLPVVASDIGGMAEKVRHEVDGLLFRVGDVDALRRALMRLVEEKELLTGLRENVQTPPTLAQHAARILDAYADIWAA